MYQMTSYYLKYDQMASNVGVHVKYFWNSMARKRIYATVIANAKAVFELKFIMDKNSGMRGADRNLRLR